MILNKTELVKRVAEENELTQKAAAAAVDSVLSAIQDTLVAGETVSLLGLGTLSIKHRDARQGRTPATGEAMEFAQATLRFSKPAKYLRKKLKPDLSHQVSSPLEQPTEDGCF